MEDVFKQFFNPGISLEFELPKEEELVLAWLKDAKEAAEKTKDRTGKEVKLEYNLDRKLVVQTTHVSAIYTFGFFMGQIALAGYTITKIKQEE